MLVLKLFTLVIVESATFQRIVENLPTVKRGGSQPFYNFQLANLLDSVNVKHDFASHLTITRKVKVGHSLRNALSELTLKPHRQNQHRRISNKRSSRFNRFMKYHSK